MQLLNGLQKKFFFRVTCKLIQNIAKEQKMPLRYIHIIKHRYSRINVK